MQTPRTRPLLLVPLAALACSDPDPGSSAGPARLVGEQALALDPAETPPAGTSLLVLDGRADRDRLLRVLEGELHGLVYRVLPPRLVVARVPEGAEAVLRELGVVARFARAVDPAEIDGATVEEARFVRVFDNRYYARGLPRALQTAPRHLVRAAGEAFESAPVAGAGGHAQAQALARGFADGGFIDTNTTPFASGTIVVSVVLPESNGRAEPSTEDWTEDGIVEAYQKVETALEAIQRSEPGSKLRFILHYESSPDNGGLPGTVDSDWEFGAHADFSDPLGEFVVLAPILGRLLGEPVAPEEVYFASFRYLNSLRDRYHADGAFFVNVAANANFTASLRAHAYINGPFTTLDSSYDFRVFMHEFGHIFGALDEYCPDACVPTTAEAGYLGMVNANAAYFAGGDGIDNGMGESSSSLMQYNDPDSVQGYTRGAWGWLDTDGDGLIEVRDTAPDTNVEAAARDDGVHLFGFASDRPAPRWGRSDGVSFNRITAVEYRVLAAGRGAPWITVPVDLPAGPVELDVAIGPFPAGEHTIEVRSRNAAGNVEPTPTTVSFVVDAAGAPVSGGARLSLDASPRIGSIRSTFALSARAVDLDAPGAPVAVRFDLDGDGAWDTGYDAAGAASAQFATPGVKRVRAEALGMDGSVVEATAEIYVLEGNAPPSVEIADLPSLAFGALSLQPSLAVAAASDPDGDPIEYNWIVESATADQPFRVESGFSADGNGFRPTLETPLALRTQPIRLFGRLPLGARVPVLDIVPLATRAAGSRGSTLIAVATGDTGLFIVDITDRASPTVLSRLALEVRAERLLLDGDRLYVLGDGLTLVDVANPSAPVELAQQRPIIRFHDSDSREQLGIPDGSAEPAVHVHSFKEWEAVEDVSVEVEVDHPAQPELRIALYLPSAVKGGGQEIVLRDHVRAPAGSRRFVFNLGTTPELRSLLGRRAAGEWLVMVTDDVRGNEGRLVSSHIRLRTSSRAVPVLPGARFLAGAIGGRHVAIAGHGLQVLDTSNPRAVREVARLRGTGAWGAMLQGTTAIVFSPLTVTPPKGEPEPTTPPPPPEVYGLYAVDLATPSRPVIRRNDARFGDDAGELFAVGRRFYLSAAAGRGRARPGDGEEPPRPTTLIGDAAAFASGAPDYIVGALPDYVFSAVIGDDRTIWSLPGGTIRGYDVSDPARVRVVKDYRRPYAYQMWQIAPGEVILWNGDQPLHAVFGDDTSTISRVFRVTLEARDPFGGQSTVSRTLHVVPYDHAPSTPTVDVYPSSWGDPLALELVIAAVDPDFPATWDPWLAARADLDGDGLDDTPWTPFFGSLWTPAYFPAPGHYVLRVQVRDSFYAVSELEVPVDVGTR